LSVKCSTSWLGRYRTTPPHYAGRTAEAALAARVRETRRSDMRRVAIQRGVPGGALPERYRAHGVAPPPRSTAAMIRISSSRPSPPLG
jgi:hypothetical protein